MMLNEKKKRVVNEGQTMGQKDKKNRLQMTMIAQQVANSSPLCALPPYELYFLWNGNVKHDIVENECGWKNNSS